MNKWSTVFLFVVWSARSGGREPFKPREGALPYIVYFQSRYRGLCVGTLVSRTAVLTAAVCVTNPVYDIKDTRPINVVTGTTYRHPRRGIRVQVTKIIIPNLSNVTGSRGYLLEKSPALLILKRKIPDILTEVPLRSIGIDYTGEMVLTLQEECFMAGWHFFYKGDKIYPVHKFLLQRNIRAQFLNVVKMNTWCEALTIKFEKALSNLGFHGYINKGDSICVRDPDRTAMPCHGMYGAPLICRGKAVAIMMAPDAQWTNCTGFSNIVHLFHSSYLKQFFACISKLFDTHAEVNINWESMKNMMYTDYSEEQVDYIKSIYDSVYDTDGSDETSSSERR